MLCAQVLSVASKTVMLQSHILLTDMATGLKNLVVVKMFSWATHPLSMVVSFLPAKLDNTFLSLLPTQWWEGNLQSDQGLPSLCLHGHMGSVLLSPTTLGVGPALRDNTAFSFLFLEYQLWPQRVVGLCNEDDSDTMSSSLFHDIPASKHLMMRASSWRDIIVGSEGHPR